MRRVGLRRPRRRRSDAEEGRAGVPAGDNVRVDHVREPRGVDTCRGGIGAAGVQVPELRSR